MSFDETIEKLQKSIVGKEAREPMIQLFQILDTESKITQEELETWVAEA